MDPQRLDTHVPDPRCPDSQRPDSRRLARIAKRHAGLFTRAEAVRCGYSSYQIRRRVRAGEWLVVAGPVLGLAGVEITPRMRDRAVHLAVAGSVLAGPSAARCWKIPVADTGQCLYIGTRGGPSIPGVRCLHGMPDARDTGMIGDVRATWRERTVFDCLRLLPAPEAQKLLDRALQNRWITVDDLIERVHREPGRRDMGRLAGLIRAVLDGTRSVAERLAAKLLRDAGVTGWTVNKPIYDADGLIGIGDVVFAGLKLVIEIDGLAFHVSATSFQRDRERQNRLVAAGWVVLRFTWQDLTTRPDAVIRLIREQIRRLSAA